MPISSTPFHSPFLLAGEKSPGFFIENLFDYIESRTKFDGLCDELNQDDVRRLTAIPSSDKAKEEGIVQMIPEEQPDGSFVLRPAATPRELLQSAQMASMHKFAKKPVAYVNSRARSRFCVLRRPAARAWMGPDHGACACWRSGTNQTTPFLKRYSAGFAASGCGAY